MNLAGLLLVAFIGLQGIGVHALKCYEYDEVQCIDDGSNAMMSMMCGFVEAANQNSTRKTCTIEGQGSCMSVTTTMSASGLNMQSTHAACQPGTVDDECYSYDEMADAMDSFSALDMGGFPSSVEAGDFAFCFCTTDFCNAGSTLTLSWITLVNSILLAATALCISYNT